MYTYVCSTCTVVISIITQEKIVADSSNFVEMCPAACTTGVCLVNSYSISKSIGQDHRKFRHW